MKYLHTYLLLFLAALVLLTGCKTTDKTRLPDLRESYNYQDKRPFGAYIAHRQLAEMFRRNSIFNVNTNFEEGLGNFDDTASIYICFALNLYATGEDINSLLRFVKNGNDAFLSVSNFDKELLDTLGCSTVNSISLYNYTGKPYNTTSIKRKDTEVRDSFAYRYFYFPFDQHFKSFNKANTKVLGVNEQGAPDFIVIFTGKGRLFLHCEPRAFSNYFLLQKNNYQYLQKVFGYTYAEPEHIYWNDYYWNTSSYSKKHAGSLDVILNNPPLAAAFWLLLILLLAYILFSMKRKQRIIELSKPNENTSVTFTETIGRLYLQKKDNKNIADKMITYFNEYIRNNYFLNTNLVNDDFITTLSRKSGVQRTKVDTLYRAIHHAHEYPDVDDYQLMSLNEQIQDFYKNRN